MNALAIKSLFYSSRSSAHTVTLLTSLRGLYYSDWKRESNQLKVSSCRGWKEMDWKSHRDMMGWSHWPIFQLLLIYESLLLQTMCLFHCQHTACQDNRHWRTKNYTLMHTRIIKLKSYSNPNCTTDLYRRHIKGGAVKQDIWTFIHLEIWDIKQVGVILKNIVWRLCNTRNRSRGFVYFSHG